MALIKCPECGKPDVSDTAEKCPQCGYSFTKGRAAENYASSSRYTAIIILSFIVALGCVIYGLNVFNSKELAILKADQIKYKWNAYDAGLNSVTTGGYISSSWSNLEGRWDKFANDAQTKVVLFELKGYVAFGIAVISLIVGIIFISKKKKVSLEVK